MSTFRIPATLFHLTVISVLGAAWLGCGTSRSSGLCENIALGEPKPGDLGAVEAAAEAAWKQRVEQSKLEEAIAQWREAIAIAPKKTENYVKLARALYLLGDGYLRLEEEEEAMVKALEEATWFAERALNIQNEDFQFAVCSKEPFDQAVGKLKKSDVPAAYWYATALGKYGLATSIVTVLDNKDRIYAMMRRILKLDPSYLHGAADRYLGAYYTKIPFPKGDLKKSRAYFERSLKRAPKYLTTHTLVAEMLAPKLKDKAEGRKLAEKHLKFVLDAPVDIIPGLEAEAKIEKQKAQRLMDDLDTIFPTDE